MMLPSIIYVVWLSYQIIYDYDINDYAIIRSKLFIVDNNSLLYIYLSVLPLVGMYLIKNSFRYFFVKIPKTLDNATDKADKGAEEKKDNLLKG